MIQQSKFQRQLLSELGISVWKLREPDLIALAPESSLTDVDEGEPTETVLVKDQEQPETEQKVVSATSPARQLADMLAGKTSNTDTDKNPQVSEQPVSPAPEIAASQVPEPALKEPERKEPKLVEPEIAEPLVSNESAKPERVLKQEVLVVNHESLPIADLTLAMEALEIPFELHSPGQELAFSYSLMITADAPSADEAQDIVHLENLTSQSKKAMWQALLKFKAESEA